MAFYDLLEKIINKLNLAVRIDEQNLSEEQKQQVRKNIGVGATQIQADHNQNDETAPDYIKNRLAWTENKVIFYQTIFISNGECIQDNIIGLQEDATYVVDVAGMQFKSKCRKVIETGDYEGSAYQIVYYVIGNTSIFNFGDNTGEPFVIGDMPAYNMSGIGVSSTIPDGNYTVKITENIINPIEPKYLPEGGFGYIDGEIEIMPEIVVPIDGGGYETDSWLLPCKGGEIYTVYWNNIPYESKCSSFDIGGTEIIAIGNLRIGDSTQKDTGEPFILFSIAGVSVVATDGDDGDYTVSIRQKIIHKINSKFIPEPDMDASIGEDGYIANRQVYKDFEKVNLLANEIIKGDYGSKIEEVNDNYSYGKCIVKFDDNEYIGALFPITTTDAHIGIDNYSNIFTVDMCFFGNLSFAFGDSASNNNLPFLFILVGTDIMVLTNDDLEHTVSVDLLVPKYHFDYDKYIPNSMVLSWDLSKVHTSNEEVANELYKAYKLLKMGQKVYAKLNNEDVEVYGISYHYFDILQYHIKCKGINNLINYDIQYNISSSGAFTITKTAEVPSIQTAEIGQTLVIKSVDKNGKPTEWGTTSLASVTDEQLTELATLLEGI